MKIEQLIKILRGHAEKHGGNSKVVLVFDTDGKVIQFEKIYYSEVNTKGDEYEVHLQTFPY